VQRIASGTIARDVAMILDLQFMVTSIYGKIDGVAVACINVITEMLSRNACRVCIML